MINPIPTNLSLDNEAVGQNQYQWTFQATFTVSDLWIADGFDLTLERLQEQLETALQNDLSYARSDEVIVSDVQILIAPDPTSIRIEQGYEN